ncbi:regulatory protein RecX [Marinoscillum sp.]|uniref:regulatory protein RecX n=1 Tax=Marinoscillum sp. TaxID=2024838 RepID=UPI003BAC1D85
MDRKALLKQAKAKAAKYCSSKERAPFQVYEKLMAWELSEDEAQHILAELTEDRFVDERRFCKAFCHDKFAFNHWGKNRIQQELFRFRLSEEVIREGLNYIDPDKYQKTLETLAIKKWSSLMDEPWPKKQKTMAYLIGKGYEIDLVIETVNQVSVSQQ